MNSDLKITLSRVLEKPLQINGTDTETHYINELFKLNEHITRYEIITRQPLTKEYIRFFNEPKKQYELTIKNCLQWKI